MEGFPAKRGATGRSEPQSGGEEWDAQGYVVYQPKVSDERDPNITNPLTWKLTATS